MTNLVDTTLQRYPRLFITDIELETLIHGTPNSRYGKVKRLLAQKKMFHIRRGLYVIASKLGYTAKLCNSELAQYIYGPSYISLESALSFHGLIPEAVYATTSVTTKKSKEFETHFGIFSYSHLPIKNFYTGVDLISFDEVKFFIAKPWKAICDYVFCRNQKWTSIDPLINSLRIEYDDLPALRDEEIALLEDYYHNSRINRFLQGVRKHEC